MEAQLNNTVINNAYATVTVGENDTVNVAPAVSASEAILNNYKRIEQLIVEREVWEQTVYRTCNEQLYALLAKCYALYMEMCGGETGARDLRNALESVISMRGLRFTKGTHTMTKIVKCVFGVDRRRVSAYSLVLREALTQKLKAEEVANFIMEKGGVEEIRRKKSDTAITPKQKAAMGKQVVSSAELAVVASNKIAEAIDTVKVGNDLVAIVTQQADGSLIVRALVDSQAVLDAALACVYSKNKSVVQNDIKNAKPANDDQYRAEAITAAASN